MDGYWLLILQEVGSVINCTCQLKQRQTYNVLVHVRLSVVRQPVLVIATMCILAI